MGQEDVDEDERLFFAAQCRDVEAARKALDGGARVAGNREKWFGMSGITPLHEAASNGCLEVFQLLLERGADKEAKTDSGQTPLHNASCHGRLKLVQLLLERGAGANAKDKEGNTPLTFAVQRGHFEVVKLLLEHGTEPNAKNSSGQTLLHEAAHCGYLEVVQLLLEFGADKEAKDNGSWTPLHVAAAGRRLEITKLLLDHGADTEATSNDGRTPLLHCCICYGNVEVATLLLECGANVEAKDNGGYTPLLMAARHNKLEIAKLLLERGADKEAKSNAGETPLDLANDTMRALLGQTVGGGAAAAALVAFADAGDAVEKAATSQEALPTCDAELLPDQATTLHVRCSAGSAELRIPAGAVERPTRVCLAVRTAQEDDLNVLGPLVALLPHGLNLLQPAELLISWRKADADTDAVAVAGDVLSAGDVTLLYCPGDDANVRGWLVVEPTRFKVECAADSGCSIVVAPLQRFCFICAALHSAALQAMERSAGASVLPGNAGPAAAPSTPNVLPSSVLYFPPEAFPAPLLQNPSLSRADPTLVRLARSGVPDGWDLLISYRVSDTGQPLGDGTALELKRALEVLGFKAFVAELDIRGGQAWANVIGQTIEKCRAVVAFCSKGYGERKWTARELIKADNLNKVLVPVLHSGQFPPQEPGMSLILGSLQRIPIGSQHNAGFKASGHSVDAVAVELVHALNELGIRPLRKQTGARKRVRE